jgi:uncharacterized RDD family membrane protein YckC
VYVPDGRYHDPIVGVALSGWWRRGLALFVDGLVLFIPSLVVRHIVGPATTTTTTFCEGGAAVCSHLHLHLGHAIESTLLVGILEFAYFLIFVGLFGRSLGMMALGIAVRNATAGRLSFGRVFIRYLLILILGWLLLIPLLVDYLSPLWDRRRQAWHDKLAGSLVVDVRKGSNL